MACLLAFPNRLDEFPRQWAPDDDRTANERNSLTHFRSEFNRADILAKPHWSTDLLPALEPGQLSGNWQLATHTSQVTTGN